jgi:SAM-dependent methyltransferase
VADAVVVGQAFHWFDATTALAEFRRVLRDGGRLGLVWNVRDRGQELQRAIDTIIEPLRGDTPSQAGGRWRITLERSRLFTPAGELHVSFSLEVEPGTVVDRIGSISFIAALDDGPREQVMQRLRRLAAEHPEPWAYMTDAYVYEASAGR